MDQAALRSKSGNKFTAWREVTPLHNALVDGMAQANLHLIVTMRAKTEYIIETDDRGRQVPRKIGMAPIQRDGLEAPARSDVAAFRATLSRLMAAPLTYSCKTRGFVSSGSWYLEGELFTLRLHQNPPSVEIRDELLIPP